jgi:zinc protease
MMVMCRPILFAISLAFIFPSAVQAIETHTLSNGLKVILQEEHKAPLITLQVWYRVGSRNEITGKTGLAHLTEHMMFKGTKRYGKGEYSRTVAKAGGSENAFTGTDYTTYFISIASDRVELALELEADRMKNLIVDPNEFELEREVVKEERRLRTEDDPQSLVVESLFATAFLVHPYHSPIIGWMTDLNHLTRDDVYHFYKRYYVPNNATLVIVGDIDPKSLLPKIRKTFGRVPRGPDVPELDVSEPEQIGGRSFELKKEAHLPFVFAGYHVPNYRHPDGYALGVLANILSSGKSSRLYQSLVYEKKLALGAGGSYDALSTDAKLFYFYGVPLPGRSIEELQKALFAEVDRLKMEPVSDRELEKAKNQIAASFIMGLDSNFFRAMQLGQAETVGAGYQYPESYVDAIRKVTPEDIQRVAKTYLVEDRRTVGVLVPLSPKSDNE